MLIYVKKDKTVSLNHFHETIGNFKSIINYYRDGQWGMKRVIATPSWYKLPPKYHVLIVTHVWNLHSGKSVCMAATARNVVQDTRSARRFSEKSGGSTVYRYPHTVAWRHGEISLIFGQTFLVSFQYNFGWWRHHIILLPSAVAVNANLLFQTASELCRWTNSKGTVFLNTRLRFL